MPVVHIALEDIDVRPELQPRTALSEEVVRTYCEEMIEGADFDPIVCFNTGSQTVLADGWHRLEAAKRARLEDLRVDLRQGTLRDALIFSLGANRTHGLRRTNADKRRCVMLALEDEEIRGWSDRRIAEVCGVGHPFVADTRRQLESDSSCTASNPPLLRVGSDGKARALPAPPAARPDPAPTRGQLPPHRRTEDVHAGDAPVIEAEAVVVHETTRAPGFEPLPMDEIERIRRKHNTKEIAARCNKIEESSRRLAGIFDVALVNDRSNPRDAAVRVMELAAFGKDPEKIVSDLDVLSRSLAMLLPFMKAQLQHLREQKAARIQ